MRRSTLTIAAAAFCQAGCLGGAWAEAGSAAPPPVTLAIAGFDYADTSGEMNDQRAAHEARLQDFAKTLQGSLAASGKYRIVPISCGPVPCEARTDPFDLQKAARAAGIKLVAVGGVHKVSTLVQMGKFQIVDEDGGRIVFDRLLTFRGDNDLAWRRAEEFLARAILEASPGYGAVAGAPPRVNVAIFDFELEDFSAAASLIAMSSGDIEQLKRATDEVRSLIAQSPGYSVADISSADAAPVKAHELRNCDGCDAAIALSLGADRSLVGFVTRLSQTEYTVAFKLRDARTGALIAIEQTDLRMGANHSWNRGAAWLIENRLLETGSRR